MIKRHLPLLLLFLTACIACFLNLGRGALYYDEAIYAQVAKEILHKRDWITLHWNGHTWFHKPPLYFWTTALLFKTFGISEFWSRFVSAVAGVCCVLASYVIAKILYGRLAGMLAGLILLSSALFVFNSRQGMTDVTLTFFILLSVYAYLRSDSDPRYWLVVWVASSLAVLTKGAVGLLVPAIISVSIVLDGRMRRDFREKYFWLGLTLFVILAGTWHVVLIGLHGRAFLDAYIFRHVLQRSVSNLHSYNYGYLFYFSVLWDFMWPWVLLIPPAIVSAWFSKRSAAMLVLALLPFLLFTISKTKFQWYIVPVIPALAIINAGFIQSLLKSMNLKSRCAAWLIIALFVIVGASDTVRFCKPDKEIQEVADLARASAMDNGPITSCPESLEMTVLFYSNRQLCTDPVVSPLSYEPSTQCEQGEIRHIIFDPRKRALVESRFYLDVLSEKSRVSYAEILQPDLVKQ